MNADKVGAIILAAGCSSRLGRPKQLLQHHGQSLVRRAAQAALGAGCVPVCIVVGAAQIESELAGLEVAIVRNEDWERGIGTSIRSGVEACLAADPGLTSIAILACDQPALEVEIISALRAKSGGGIAAAAYGGTLGVPAIFSRRYFPDLRTLPDDQGAKRLLQTRAHDVTAVPFPGGSIDIDTPADLRHCLPTR